MNHQIIKEPNKPPPPPRFKRRKAKLEMIRSCVTVLNNQQNKIVEMMRLMEVFIKDYQNKQNFLSHKTYILNQVIQVYEEEGEMMDIRPIQILMDDLIRNAM